MGTKFYNRLVRVYNIQNIDDIELVLLRKLNALSQNGIQRSLFEYAKINTAHWYWCSSAIFCFCFISKDVIQGCIQSIITTCTK